MLQGQTGKSKKMLENCNQTRAIGDWEDSASSSSEGMTSPNSIDPVVSRALEKHRQEFLGYLQSKTGNRDDAEDVWQDFCLKVLLKSNQVRDRSSPVGWLRIVLKSVLTDHFRHKKRERQVLLEYATEQGVLNVAPPPTYVPSKERRAVEFSCFQSQFSELKQEYAQALFWIDLRGESQTEVAAKLGITDGNLRVRLYRARAALRDILGHSCTDCKKTDCAISQLSKARMGEIEKKSSAQL